MSTKAPERIPFEHFYFQSRTVGLMIENGWTIISQCEACGLQMTVDLALIVTVKGPAVTLWNRRQRCKKLGCSGWVYFLGKHPRRLGFDPLKIDPKAPL